MATITAARSSTNWAAGIEGCLLVGIGAMLLRKWRDGQLPLYIHPRYTTLIMVTGIALLIIGAVRLWQTSDAPQTLRSRLGVYGLLLAPLLLGVLIPAAPVGSAMIDPVQLNQATRGYRQSYELSNEDSREWTLLDWMYARHTLTPEQVQNRPVDVVGFVYRTPEQAADEFYVVRYTVSCCVADRNGVSLPVRYAGASALQNDQWVQVSGTIESRPGDGTQELLVADSSVEPVAQPKEPYLNP